MSHGGVLLQGLCLSWLMAIQRQPGPVILAPCARTPAQRLLCLVQQRGLCTVVIRQFQGAMYSASGFRPTCLPCAQARSGGMARSLCTAPSAATRSSPASTMWGVSRARACPGRRPRERWVGRWARGELLPSAHFPVPEFHPCSATMASQ